MNDNVEPARQAWRLFLQAQAVLLPQLSEQLEKEIGLPLTWYDVLAQLKTAPCHKRRLQDLGQCLLLSKSGLTRRIDRMEERGLVKREGCAEDRRGAFAVLTPAGHDALEQAIPVHLAAVHEHFMKYLSDDEANAMVSALTKVVDAAPPDVICGRS